jgi:eukaryotic-like serine/threonine-protein kinase
MIQEKRYPMRRKQILVLSALTVTLLSCLCPATNIAEQISDQFGGQEPIEVLEQLPSETPVIEEVIQDSPDTLIYRANLERTGVYQSPGPKSSPNLVWKFPAGDSIYSAPAIFEGVAYFGSHDGHLYAVDIAAGEALWSYETDDMVISSPMVANDVIYFGSDDGHLFALDIHTGEMLWAYKTGDWVSSSPVVSAGMVIFGSWDGFLYALDAQTGVEVWKYEVEGIHNPAEGLQKGVDNSPAISDGRVLFGSSQIGGASRELFFYALDLQTGEVLWSYSTWNVITSPAVLGSKVYFGGFGSFYGFNLQDGSLELEFRSGIVTTAPALENGVAYYGTEDGYLFAVDLERKEEKWVFETGDYISFPPSVSNGVVYFGSSNGMFRALDSHTGQLLWEYDTGERISTSPVISGGVIYFGTDEGHLYALE